VSASRLDRALRLLEAALWASIARLGLWVVLFQLLQITALPSGASLLKAQQLLSLGVEGLLVSAWLMLAAATPARHGWVRATAVMATLSCVIDVLFVLLPTVDLGGVSHHTASLVWLALLPVSWHALEQLGDERGVSTSEGAMIAMWSATVLRAVIWAVRVLHLVPAAASVQGTLAWLSSAVALAGAALLLGATRRVRAAGVAAAPEAATSAVAPAPAPARNDVLVGALWLGGGLLVSLVSYATTQGSGGGHYVITTGAIGYGLVRMVRGLGLP
jgi:hypothetical protein